jgi:hypothetical protein
MKKYIYLIVIVFWTFQIYSQESYTPKKAVKASFFDTSVALRDMKIIKPEDQISNWKKGEIENEFLEFDSKINENISTDVSSVQFKPGTKGTKGPILNIDGTGNINGVYPPDTDGDIGLNNYIQMINLSFAVYDKSGNKIYGPVANSTLWSGFPGPWTGTNDGDPIILYDELADRWLASQFALPNYPSGPFYELVAVSQTSDPLGSWSRYAFEFDYMPDYPKLAVWADGYYGTFHMFNNGNYKGMGVAVFERDKMLIGDPGAQMVYWGEYPTRYGYLPSDIDGSELPAGSPNYIAGMNFFGNHSMEIWNVTVDWLNTNNSTFTLSDVLTPATFNDNINGIPQPGTSQKLDEFTSRLMFRLPFRSFSGYNVMLANHTINVSGKAAIRWYELRDEGSGWYIYQQGTYAPDNNFRWMGSLAMGSNGTIALGYSVSSSTVYPSVRYTGRSADAPLGEMNMSEIEIVAGLSSQSGIDRWGDYSCMTVDPSNDTTFWFTNEYMKSNGWGTRICSFDFGALQPPQANAGPDATICDNVLFNTQPTALYYNNVQWVTSGDGVFQNPNILMAKYLRGNQDIENGSVTLTLTVYGFEPGWQVTDSLLLTIIKQPEALAGNDTTISGNSVLLNGQAISYSSVVWTSSGDGSFDNPSLLQSTYTPGPNDVSAGQVTLTLTANAQEPCSGDDSDNMTLFITPATGISQTEINDFQIFIIPNPSNGKFQVILGNKNIPDLMITIRDYTGRSINNKPYNYLNAGSIELDLSAYPKGIYILDISAGDIRKLKKIILK